ncbi:MAG: sulfotransferase family protein [Vicinamibacterales bacterium]
MRSPQRLRAAKPPFHKNVLVRHPVNPWIPLASAQVRELCRLQPCVVMGRGHSGTRLVAWICHHLGVQMGVDAVRPSGDPIDRSFQHHLRIVATRSLDVRKVRQLYYRDRNRFQKAVHGYYRRLGSPAGPWGWKFPEAYVIGPYVHDTFPSARYIHLLRDGRDIAFKRHLTDVSEHRLARRILHRQDALELPHHLQAALSWALQVELFTAFQSSLPPGRVLTIRYEQMVEHPHHVATEIAQFLGVSMTEACESYIEREVSRSHAGQYRREDALRVREVEERIGPTLRELNYL